MLLELTYWGFSGLTSAVLYLSYTTTHPKISSFNARLTEFMISLHDLWLFSSFRSEFCDITNNEWHTTDDVTSCNTCRRRHRSDAAPRHGRYDVIMEFGSEFWCTRNCSSTMRAFPRSALRVIWYFYHTADRHPRSCDISFVLFQASWVPHRSTKCIALHTCTLVGHIPNIPSENAIYLPIHVQCLYVQHYP
jgi:hypothetical protein